LATKEQEAGSRQAQELRDASIHGRMLGKEEARKEHEAANAQASTGDPLLDQLCDAVRVARPVGPLPLALNDSPEAVAAAIGLPPTAA
jgi:hypothetical protein